jgi:crossover junction endodeoxyribonuclease RusA
VLYLQVGLAETTVPVGSGRVPARVPGPRPGGGPVRIEVNGIPAPQGSKRHVGGGRMVESSRALGPWREAVRAETQRVLEQLPEPDGFLEGPVLVDICFWLPRPKSLPKKVELPVKRPDLDKLVRAVLDGLVSGGAMADDSQVVSLIATKDFATSRPPGCLIIVKET